MDRYTVAIIGSGPGGYVAAIRCAQLGLSTVLIEKESIGGTCLNAGCIPTKALVRNAEILHAVKGAKRRGIVVGKPEVDMAATMKMKGRVVSQLVRGVEMLLSANRVTVLRGVAEIESETHIRVGDQDIFCEKLIIATGSSAFIPPVPGLEDEGILTATEILSIDHLPQSLCVIGGGVIGCELATVFASFGSKVTVLEMLPHLVPNMDNEVSGVLKKSLTGLAVDVKTDCRVTGVSRKANSYIIEMAGDGKEAIEAEKILVSAGRRGNTAGLEKLGIVIEGGYITTDDRMRTNRENVFAIGDVTGRNQLAHVASAQGIVAAEAIAGRESTMHYDVVPNCVYTIPEIGSVGLMEQEAKAAGYDVVVGTFPMAASGRAKAMGETTGFTKIVAERDGGRVLGGCVVGSHATEVIGELVYAIQNGGSLDDLTHTIHAHPTISETIMEAAHAALGMPLNNI